MLLQLTPLVQHIFLQIIINPEREKNKITKSKNIDLQIPADNTGIKIQFAHSTNKQDTDSLPIFPVQK